jgi:maltooligosyltrehalose trehalohydrolase
MVAATAAAAQRTVELVLLTGQRPGGYPLEQVGQDLYETWVPGAAPGDRYAYRLDGRDVRPDPASRYQPDGVHGPSEVVAPDSYHWRDAGWQGGVATEQILYELHVGTFTPEGTFDAARRRLPYLADLGVTTIELMPVADFAGTRNWGYDGVCLFAPSRAYGRPEDLRAFVDAAHAHGLGVMLDVVYNHLGPEGAYLPQFNPHYFTNRHTTAWGSAVNLDDRGSDLVRRFIIDNATHWIREYHVDGLRLDATHAFFDDSPTQLLAELTAEIRSQIARPVTLHAEDHRNLASMLHSPQHGGCGLDGIWADDFHHVLRRLMAGDWRGYYQDYEGTIEELVETIRQGWFYSGQPSRRTNLPRGSDPSRLPMRQFIVCIQNHDQVGNRARGDRLHHQIDLATWRAASALLLTVPMTPLLFMGQEWSASSPFQYFTDLEPGLGASVTAGRRREFKDFPEFSDPAVRERIPDPQAAATFESSKLRWDEMTQAPHAPTLALYKRLLALRKAHPALQASERREGEAWAQGADALVVRRRLGSECFVIAVRLCNAGAVDLQPPLSRASRVETVLTTEDSEFAPDPHPPDVARSHVHFLRPGAVVLRVDA